MRLISTVGPTPVGSARVTLVAGVCCAVLGLVVIVGWHTGLSSIVRLRMQYRPMPYGSALSFFLTGLALAALAYRRVTAARLLACAVLAVLVMSNSAAVGGPDLSFERLFALQSLGGVPEFFGRMPPNAALNFTLAAAAVLCLTLRRVPLAAVALMGSIIGAISVTAIFGYATDLAGAYAWRGLPAMALHGAIGFVVIASACVYAAWMETRALYSGTPQWAPVPAGIAAGTASLVLWQALLREDHVTLAHATLYSGFTVAFALALSMHFALTARRQLRRAEATARELAAEIAERHRVEEALRDSELRLRQMIDANPIGVVRIDAYGHILDANEAYLRIVGRTRAELETGRVQWNAMALPEYLPRDELAIAAARENGRSDAYENEFLRGDGRVPVLIAWASIGSSRELTAFVLDITDRKI